MPIGLPAREHVRRRHGRRHCRAHGLADNYQRLLAQLCELRRCKLLDPMAAISHTMAFASLSLEPPMATARAKAVAASSSPAPPMTLRPDSSGRAGDEQNQVNATQEMLERIFEDAREMPRPTKVARERRGAGAAQLPQRRGERRDDLREEGAGAFAGTNEVSSGRLVRAGGPGVRACVHARARRVYRMYCCGGPRQ